MNTDALYDAALSGDVDAIAKLDMKADKLNDDEQTILHIESINGNTERVLFILKEFANKNLLVKLGNQNETALIWAANNGHTEVVEVLIDAAKQLPPSDNPVTSFQAFLRHGDKDLDTALNVAVLRGHAAIAKLLVEADPSDTHVQNKDGKTPIYTAAEKGYHKIVKEICKTCPAPSLDGPDGSTALHAAISNIHKARGLFKSTYTHDRGSTLIKYNNIHKANEEDRDVIRLLIDGAKRSHESFEAIFNKTDENGHTILELAVEGNHMDMVELILVEDPAYARGNKKHDLMCLINKAVDEGFKTVVNLLSDTYEGINPDHKGVVDLILAIRKRDKDSVLNLLRDAKHLLNFSEDEGWTPLHYAAYYEYDSVLEDIIKAQKEVHCQFVYEDKISTPFHVAAENGWSSTVIQLTKIWVDEDMPVTYKAVNKIGQNVLHLAAAGKKKKMIHGFLEKCPECYWDEILNQQDDDGNTPLHILISNGCFIPKLIKYKGPATMVKNKKNWTPQDMLYSDEDIIGDQVQIKILLDNIHTNKHRKSWEFWCTKSMEITKPDTSENAVLPSRRGRKDAKFNKAKKLFIDEKDELTTNDLKRYKDRTNTQILVAALITTVTFTVGFTMPGGLHQSGEFDEGLVIFSRKRVFNAFMISDVLALLLSTSSLLFYFLQSMDEDLQQVSKLNVASTVLNIASIVAMMLTFVTGAYLVLSHSPILAIIVCIIGSLFFVLIIVLLIKMVYRVKENKD